MILIIVLLMTGVFAGSTRATPAAAGPHRIVDDNDTAILYGNVNPLARPEFDRGPTNLSLPMERMVLTLKMDPERQAALEKFIAGLHDPGSPDFGQWLTPEEFGERFGHVPEDIKVITVWLISHGFVIEEVAKGRSWINFSGPVADVERAFHTQIHDYYVDGQLHHANAQDPSIPRGLSDLVGGIVSLDDFPRKAMNNGIRPVVQSEVTPDYTSGANHYLSPGDFAIIYNVNSLYSAGIDGSGVSIAIVGRTHPSSSDWTAFRSMMGLPSNPPQVIVNGPDPGDVGGGEDVEADLDVEWSGAVAKNAAIKFVVSKSTHSTDGVDLSAQYIVNNNLASVMSTSFGSCESDMGTAENSFYNNLWQQAAAQGITSFVSSGDSGAAGCNLGSDTAGSGLGVNGLASTPYNVAVGGTQFNEGSGSYWNSINGSAYTSAISYIPELAWNESGVVPGGSDLWATGGGASSIYSKPLWQAAPGVPADGKRDVPDVSLSGAVHDAYLVETGGGLYAVGGTSASSPSFAGLMALIVQEAGQRQGNANTRLYEIGNSQYGAGGVAVFHDVTSGGNSVPGVSGYLCTTGYDLSTGLGSVDAHSLVTNWTPDFTISAMPDSMSVPQGEMGASNVSTTVSGNFGDAISLSASNLPQGTTATFSPNPITPTGSSTLTINVGGSSTPGTYSMTVTGVGGGVTRTTSVNLTILQVFPITSSVTNGIGGTVTPGTTTVASGDSITVTISPNAGYHLATLTDNGVDVTANVINGSYTLTNIIASHTVVATFAINTYSISASVNGGDGSINPTSTTINYGAPVTFTITLNSGYILSGLTDNGTAVTATQAGDGSYTYTIASVTEGHTIQASFTPVVVSSVPALRVWGMIATMAFLAGYKSRRRRKR